jgi:hypothetical protein
MADLAKRGKVDPTAHRDLLLALLRTWPKVTGRGGGPKLNYRRRLVALAHDVMRVATSDIRRVYAAESDETVARWVRHGRRMTSHERPPTEVTFRWRIEPQGGGDGVFVSAPVTVSLAAADELAFQLGLVPDWARPTDAERRDEIKRLATLLEHGERASFRVRVLLASGVPISVTVLSDPAAAWDEIERIAAQHGSSATLTTCDDTAFSLRLASANIGRSQPRV